MEATVTMQKSDDKKHSVVYKPKDMPPQGKPVVSSIYINRPHAEALGDRFELSFKSIAS